MTELGRFQQDINTWRAALAATSGDNLYTVYCAAAEDFGAFVNNGLDRGTAVDMLMQLNEAYHVIEDLDEVENVISDAFDRAPKPTPKPQPKTNGAGQQQAKAPQPQHDATEYPFPEEADMATRSWVYGNHYALGFVSATVAPGGFGKTTLALHEALNMAFQGWRVWYISGEDDMDELRRRIGAHCKKHELFKSDFGGRFFVNDKLTFPIKIARSSKNGPEFDAHVLDEIERAIERHKIDVVIFDPLVSFHMLAESDTTQMDALIKRLGEICSRRKCCIELAHHVRKPDSKQGEITVYDARGAGAIINAVRSCRVINIMTMIEAQQLKTPIPPDKLWSYLRLDNGKRNMVAAEKARWLHLVSVQLANGDNVQALEPFEYKIDQTTESDEAWVAGVLSSGKSYRADSRSPDWFGVVVAQHFGRGHDTRGEAIWINKQIKKWLTPDGTRRPKPLIRKVTREDEHRHEKLYYELVDNQE